MKKLVVFVIFISVMLSVAQLYVYTRTTFAGQGGGDSEALEARLNALEHATSHLGKVYSVLRKQMVDQDQRVANLERFTNFTTGAPTTAAKLTTIALTMRERCIAQQTAADANDHVKQQRLKDEIDDLRIKLNDVVDINAAEVWRQNSARSKSKTLGLFGVVPFAPALPKNGEPRLPVGMRLPLGQNQLHANSSCSLPASVLKLTNPRSFDAVKVYQHTANLAQYAQHIYKVCHPETYGPLLWGTKQGQQSTCAVELPMGEMIFMGEGLRGANAGPRP